MPMIIIIINSAVTVVLQFTTIVNPPNFALQNSINFLSNQSKCKSFHYLAWVFISCETKPGWGWWAGASHVTLELAC